MVNHAGQFRLRLPAGSYSYRVLDRAGRVLAGPVNLTISPNQSEAVRLPAINIANR